MILYDRSLRICKNYCIFGRILLRWWSCVQMDFAKHMETHLKLTTKHVWSSSTGFLHKTYTWRSSYPQSSLHFTMVGMDLWSTTIRGSSLSSDSPSACCTTPRALGLCCHSKTSQCHLCHLRKQQAGFAVVVHQRTCQVLYILLQELTSVQNKYQ